MLPSAAEQSAIAPYAFCTDPRTPREMFCSFVFTSLTFAVTTQQPTELPILAVLAGKRLAGVPQPESITAEWKGAALSPLELSFGEGVPNRDVAEQKPVRLKATPFPLQHDSLLLQPSKFLQNSVPCLIRDVKWQKLKKKVQEHSALYSLKGLPCRLTPSPDNFPASFPI